jgi:hypothetical protein
LREFRRPYSNYSIKAIPEEKSVISLRLDELYWPSLSHSVFVYNTGPFSQAGYAGSNPVSRSMLSIAYRLLAECIKIANGVIAVTTFRRSQCLRAFCEDGRGQPRWHSSCGNRIVGAWASMAYHALENPNP